MKKIVALMIAVLLLFAGCYDEKPISNPITFYYIPAEPMLESDFHHDVSYIRPDVRDGSYLGTSVVEMIVAYLRGPSEGSGLASPFPAGTFLYSINRSYDTVYVIMDGTFSTLTDLDLTIACTCLAKTCIELTGAQIVEISAKDSLLDGSASIRLDLSAIEIFDSSIQGGE